MRHVRAIFKLTLVALTMAHVFNSDACAQVLSDNEIGDLETLEWLREIGHIDEDEYDRWEEKYVDSLNPMMDSIISVQSDRPGISGMKRSTEPSAMFNYGLHQRVDETEPYRQTYRLVLGHRRKLSGEASFESYHQGNLTCRRRLLVARVGGGLIRIGDIDPIFCGGLVAGSHPIFLKSKSPSQSFLFPSRSRFNGAQLETSFSKTNLSAFVSSDEDTRFSATAFGSQVNRRLGANHYLGASVIAGQIRNRDSGSFKNTATAGLDIGAKTNSMSGKLQIAVDNDRQSALMFEIRRGYDAPRISGWHYSGNFFNPFGAGKSNSDTREVYVPEIDLTYRSRQAEETGVLVENQFGLTRVDRTNLAANWWRTGDIEKLRIKATSAISLTETDEVRLVLMTGDDNIAADGFQIHSARCTITGAVQWLSCFSTTALSAYIRSSDDGQVTKTSRSVELRLRGRPQGFAFDFRLRWYDPDQSDHGDHYFYISVSEAVKASDNLRLSILASTKLGPQRRFSEDTILRIETAVAM